MDLNKAVPPWQRKSWRKRHSNTMRMQNGSRSARLRHLICTALMPNILTEQSLFFSFFHRETMGLEGGVYLYDCHLCIRLRARPVTSWHAHNAHVPARECHTCASFLLATRCVTAPPASCRLCDIGSDVDHVCPCSLSPDLSLSSLLRAAAS